MDSRRQSTLRQPEEHYPADLCVNIWRSGADSLQRKAKHVISLDKCVSVETVAHKSIEAYLDRQTH